MTIGVMIQPGCMKTNPKSFKNTLNITKASKGLMNPKKKAIETKKKKE